MNWERLRIIPAEIGVATKSFRKRPADTLAPVRNPAYHHVIVPTNHPTAVSLFTGAGIGDVGFRAAGMEFLAMAELVPERAALAGRNFPKAKIQVGDLWEIDAQLCAAVGEQLGSRELFLLSCTAPCQGMSKNGQGTLLRNIREGKRSALDPRNRLILPALGVMAKVRPRWIVLENVPAMRNTLIEDDKGKLRPILDVVFTRLAPEYVGMAYDVEFADHGVPQRRQRLITVLTRDAAGQRYFEAGGSFLPMPSHSRAPDEGKEKWVSVAEALADFPPLDGRTAATAGYDDMAFHRVPVLDPKKYTWIKHTPIGRSAFDNQCINPECLYQHNPAHGNKHDASGINRANRETPLYCLRCGSLLPRPHTVQPDGILRIMSGYTSAYKRMDPDAPAPALTRNLSYPCSDQKLHAFENRVLSLAEAMRLHTLDAYGFAWGPLSYKVRGRLVKKRMAPDTLMRLVIGESVPPRFFELLGKHLLAITGRREHR